MNQGRTVNQKKMTYEGREVPVTLRPNLSGLEILITNGQSEYSLVVILLGDPFWAQEKEIVSCFKESTHLDSFMAWIDVYVLLSDGRAKKMYWRDVEDIMK